MVGPVFIVVFEGRRENWILGCRVLDVLEPVRIYLIYDICSFVEADFELVPAGRPRFKVHFALASPDFDSISVNDLMNLVRVVLVILGHLVVIVGVALFDQLDVACKASLENVVEVEGSWLGELLYYFFDFGVWVEGLGNCVEQSYFLYFGR